MRSFGAVLALSLLISIVGSLFGLLDPGPPTDQPHWVPNIHK